MPHYPLFADLYNVDEAVYRRPPYRGATTKSAQLPIGGGDTEDLYDDDNLEDEEGYKREVEEEEREREDGPPCGIGSIPAEREQHGSSSMGPPPGFGAPPGISSGFGRNSGKPAPAFTAKKPAAPAAAPPTSAPPTNTPPTSAPRASSGVVSDEDPRVKREGEKRWTSSFDVPANMFGMLIGTKGAKKREMEDSTRCRILFPERNSLSTTVRIVSSVGAENVSRCLDMIEAVVLIAQKSGKVQRHATHFAAIPCTHPIVRQRFVTFKDVVEHAEEIHPSCRLPSLFPSQHKLHMTIGMLQIQTDEQQEALSMTLFKLQQKFSTRKPILVTVEGLDIMNDDPSDVQVLFAKLKGEGLQEMVDDIKTALEKAGLTAREEKGSVKMHMTVMNSRYAACAETGKKYEELGRDGRRPFNFDATKLIEGYGDFEFGFFTLDRITICTLGTTDETTGFYELLVDARID